MDKYNTKYLKLLREIKKLRDKCEDAINDNEAYYSVANETSKLREEIKKLYDEEEKKCNNERCDELDKLNKHIDRIILVIERRRIMPSYYDIKKKIDDYKGNDKIDINDELLKKLSVKDINYDIIVDAGKVYDQEDSSSCWLISLTDYFNHKLKDAGYDKEISMQYLIFCLQFDSAINMINYTILNDSPLGDKEYDVNDLEDFKLNGGYLFDYYALLEKHGVVFEDDYKTSDNCFKNINVINNIILKIVKKFRIEEASSNGEELYKLQDMCIDSIINVLIKEYGIPPKEVEFNNTKVSPKELYRKSLKDVIKNSTTVSVNKLKEFNTVVNYDKFDFETYNIRYKYIISLIVNELKKGKMVPVVLYSPIISGFANNSICNYEDVIFKNYGFDLSIAPDDMRRYHDYNEVHQVLVCGVKFDEDGKPLYFKLKNSYGNQYGDNGFIHCKSDAFRKYFGFIIMDRDVVLDKIEFINKVNEKRLALHK